MVIIGAKGFAKELLETLHDNQIEEFIFFDDQSREEKGCIFENFKVLRSIDECKDYFKQDARFILGVGNPLVRKRLAEKFSDVQGRLTSLISIHARVGKFNQIMNGTTILQNVVIENDNIIGLGCLIHVGSFISHDVKIGDFCEISPFVKLLGNCSVGDNCSIGTGAVVLPGIIIGNNVKVGAGAVVTKNVQNNQTVIGIPAKLKGS